MNVAVVVPAAGQGTRLRAPGEPSKQFRLLGGRPVLVRTVEALLRHEGVQLILVAAPPGDRDATERLLGELDLGSRLKVVEGGASRQESVARALAEVPPSIPLIAVHDAVRPFLSLDRLDAVLTVAAESGAAALAIPVADTLRHVDGEVFGDTVDRAGLWRMQTPQAFHASVLREAHARAAMDSFSGTDEIHLVSRLGVTTRLVTGGSANTKITTPADWELAETVWPAWEERELMAND